MRKCGGLTSPGIRWVRGSGSGVRVGTKTRLPFLICKEKPKSGKALF